MDFFFSKNIVKPYIDTNQMTLISGHEMQLDLWLRIIL